MKKLLFTFFIASYSFMAIAGDNAFEKDVEKFMELNGSKQAFDAVVSQMIGQYKFSEVYKNVDVEFWLEMEKEMLGEGGNSLISLMVPIYQKHFTHNDIKAFIAFYESEAGRKLAQKTPVITEEAMQVGQQWGAEMATKIIKKIENSK